MNEQRLENEYPGVGRLHYFLGNVGIIAFAVFVIIVFGPESRVMSITTLMLMFASFALDVMRLRNIGVSQWFVFLRYLPFGKTLMWFGLTSAQTGWMETRRLDSAGKSILFVEALLFAVMLFLIFRTGMTIFGITEFRIPGYLALASVNATLYYLKRINYATTRLLQNFER